MTLWDLWRRYTRAKPLLSKAWRRQLEITIRQAERFAGVVNLDDLSLDRIEEFRERILIFGRGPVTANSKTANLLALWRFAHDRGFVDRAPPRVEPLPVPKRIPRAWRPEEIARILDACDRAPMRRTWGPDHWRALVLVIYDTSMRLGCLLEVPRSVIQGDLICIPAEYQKGDADTIHRLHPDTVTALGRLPKHTRRLFAWPYHTNDIWPRFRGDILEVAGLAATRRDLFHKIRRTSYTLVYGALGPQAATAHAAHASDLSRNYLDPTMLDRPEPISVIPRPGADVRPPEPEPTLRIVG